MKNYFFLFLTRAEKHTQGAETFEDRQNSKKKKIEKSLKTAYEVRIRAVNF